VMTAPLPARAVSYSSELQDPRRVRQDGIKLFRTVRMVQACIPLDIPLLNRMINHRIF
jgi:hypothetical protein